MNWVLALFAFAGVMAVMSTVVSVCVEAVHKVFRLRGGGLQDMLMALHDEVIAPIDPNQPEVTQALAGPTSKQAKSFAKEMRASPSYGSNSRYRVVSSVPFMGLLNRRFENLSKLQFVEQLPRTAFGQSLANKPREEIRSTLNKVVYEFDRFGASQTDFFRARAKILTTLIAMVIVVVGNFNAITLYTYLAKDPGASSAISNIVQNNPEIVGQIVDKKIAESRAAGQEEAQVEDMVVAVAERFKDMQELGLPVGRAYFPYCLNPDAPGCELADGEALKTVKIPLIPYESQAIPRMLTSEGFVWLIGMVATAGLIGLGAPFWFNLFKSLAGLVMRSQSFNASARAVGEATAVSAPAPGELRRPKEPNPSLAKPGQEPDLDILTDAFLIVSGKDTGAPPMGRRLGDASAEATGVVPAPVAAPTAMSADELGAADARMGAGGLHGIRRLRT